MLIASDANSDDYDWTETFLTRSLHRHPAEVPTTLAYIGKQAQVGMISVHFYTFSGNDWGKKSPAFGFSEDDWARSMERTWKTDEMIARHSVILDRHDPKGQVGISFSEWGAWWAKDKKRPSNLYQANTLRDAVIAGLTLNIFQNHAARVRMANIAQMVNVLQSLILTDREKMLVTPTYHVFDLYQGHQGATLLPTEVAAPDYTVNGVEAPLAQRERFTRRRWRDHTIGGQYRSPPKCKNRDPDERPADPDGHGTNDHRGIHGRETRVRQSGSAGAGQTERARGAWRRGVAGRAREVRGRSQTTVT